MYVINLTIVWWQKTEGLFYLLHFPYKRIFKHVNKILELESQIYSTPSWQASLELSRTPFCCYDLLQMRCITRHHQLLAAFLRNLCPFLMCNGL